jgi:hypothetical protein
MEQKFKRNEFSNYKPNRNPNLSKEDSGKDMTLERPRGLLLLER